MSKYWIITALEEEIKRLESLRDRILEDDRRETGPIPHHKIDERFIIHDDAKPSDDSETTEENTETQDDTDSENNKTPE